MKKSRPKKKLLSEEETIEKVYLKALNFLSYRRRSEKEINDRLDQYFRKEKSNLKEAVLSKLKEEGFVDDSRFTQEMVLSLSRSNSPRGVYSKLYKRGINKELVDESLSALEEDYEYESACRVFDKKVKNPALLGNPSMRKKIMDFLFRKGYSWDIIRRVFDTRT